LNKKSQVVEAGAKATDYKVGDRVCVDTHLPCEECWQCKNGVKVFIIFNSIIADLKTHPAKNLYRKGICANMGLFGHGVKTDQGGCSQYATAPINAVYKLK
jgi:threonine dehydrogenase-like Zn-dependent dehydrogenase